jgi:hypothetical protein
MAILPIGAALLMFRLAEVGWQIWRGEATTLVADEAQHTVDDFLGQSAKEAVMPATPPPPSEAAERPR